MDEFQIEVLIANGYNVSNGGIVDAEGNYVSAVELNGKTHNSIVDQDTWNIGESNKAQYGDLNTPYDNIVEFKANPTQVALTEDSKANYEGYAQEQAALGLDVYPDADTFQRESEKNVEEKMQDDYLQTLRNLQEEGHDGITDEYINASKANEELIRNIESENPSYSVNQKKKDDTDERLAENSFFNPENISIYTEKAVLAVADFMRSDTAGMEGSEEDKKEYQKALDRRSELKKPAMGIVKTKLDEKIAQATKAYDELGVAEAGTPDNDILRYAINEMQSESDNIGSFLDGDSVYNPFNAKYAINTLSAGFQGVFDKYVHYQPLAQKITNGEELTPNEQIAAESLGLTAESQGVELDQHAFYDLTRGTMDSAAFLVGGAVGRVAMKGVTKGLTLAATKKFSSNLWGKVAGESANMVGQAVLHPQTHEKAIDKYWGPITIDTDENGETSVTTDRKTYKTLMEEMDIEKEAIEDRLALETDPEEKGNMQARLSQIEVARNSVKKPETAFNSIAYGFTETLKENAIENYLGRGVAKAFNNPLTKKIVRQPWAKGLANSTVGKAAKQADNLFGGAKKYVNEITGNKGSRLIGGNLEEVGEELVTQLVPVWGETDVEAQQRRGELLESSFYGKVIGQTILMGGLMKSVHAPKQALAAYKNSKNLKDKRKAFKVMVAEFKKSGITDEKIEELLMSAGEGNYSVQDYNNKIAKLRKEGKHAEANDIERNRTYNTGKTLVEMGRGQAFVRNMTALLATGGIPSASIASVQAAVNEVKVLEAEMSEHGNLRNKNYVLELKSKQRYTKEQRRKLELRISETLGKEQSPERDGEVQGMYDAIADLDKLDAQLSRAVQVETSSAMRKRLEQEAELGQELISQYKKEKKNQKTEDTKELRAIRNKAIIDLDQKYGNTVKSKVKSQAQKSLDTHIFKEGLAMHMKKAQKQAEAAAKIKAEKAKETPEVEVPAVELAPDVQEVVTHAEEIGPDIDEVTKIADQQELEYTETRRLSEPTPPVIIERPGEDKLSDPTLVDDSDVADPDLGLDTPLDDDDGADVAFFDDMPRMADGTYENDGLNELAAKIKARVKAIEKRDGVAPTFEEYIEELIEKGGVDPNNLRGHMRGLALGWSAAQLGNSNWRAVYNDMFNNLKGGLDLVNSQNTEVSEDVPVEVQEKRDKKEVEVTDKKTPAAPVKYEPGSGKPVFITPNNQKSYGTEHKTNYSAIEFTEVVEVVDGQKVYTKVNAPIPTANMGSSVNWWDLANPNKNNAGDQLIPTVLEGTELENTTISMRDPKTGVKTGEISFGAWVESQLEEKGISFDEFEKSKEYRDRVPMVYVDSNGSKVAYVPEVQWFNPTSVGDSTQDVEQIDLNNLSPSHQKEIDENKRQTSELRESIINGDVVAMEIKDNLSFPPLQKIAEFDAQGMKIPTKTLNEVSPNSEIVWMTSGGHLQNLSKDRIDFEDDILNLGDFTSGLLERELVKDGDLTGRFPVKRNTALYLNFVGIGADGRKKYIGLSVQRKDENGNNSANQEDVQTARWIAAINKVTQFDDNVILKDPQHPLHMTKEQAEDLRRQIKDITGIDVKSEYTDIIESLVAHLPPAVDGKDGKRTKTLGKTLANFLSKYNKDTKQLATPPENFTQNMKLAFKGKNKPMISIKKVDGKFVVEKVKISKLDSEGNTTEAQTYEEFLKDRLSTNIMGYNVGTESDPVYTIAPQQKILLTPVFKEDTTPAKEVFDKEVEELKTNKEVVKKVEEVEVKEEITPPAVTLTEDQKGARKAAMEKATAIAKKLNLNIRDTDDTDDLVSTEMTTVEEVSKGISNVAGLTVKQEEEMVDWIFGMLAPKDADQGAVRGTVSAYLALNIEEMNQAIADLKQFEGNEVVGDMIDTLESAVEQNYNISESLDALFSEALLRGENVSFITDKFDVEEYEQNSKDYSKSSNETKSIDKVGTALKRVFAQVTTGQTGFMGVDTHPSFKQMYDTVTLSLSSDTNLTPNFAEMMAILKKRDESTVWMKPLIEALENSDEQVKNQFVYNTYQQKAYAKFAAVTYKSTGVDSRVFSSNANEANRAVVERWRENFKRSPLNNDGLINKDTLQIAVEEWNSWVESDTLASQTDAVYTKWLGRFGIELSQGAMKALRDGELNVSASGGKLKPAKFSELFDGLTAANSTNRSGNLFTNLMKYSLLNKGKAGDIEFYDNTSNHPFDDMGTILTQVAELEAKYNPVYGSTTRYVAGKSVSEMESFNYFYEQHKKLKNSALSEDQQYLNDMKELSFSSDSFILDLLMNDKVFANQFEHGLADLMYLKELYKATPMFAGVEDLSGVDYMFAQRTMFQDKKQGKARSVEGLAFDVRMAHMSTLTNSDKGRMMLLKTAVFDLYNQSEQAFDVSETGEVTFKEDLSNLLHSQLVLPELKRMIKFLQKSEKTNISKYDKGAERFNILPVLNTIENSAGDTIQDVILSSEGTAAEVLEIVEGMFKDSFSKVIQENIVAEAKQNVEELSDFNNTKENKDGFNNASYLASRAGTVSENMLISELDYTINSMISNMNYMQLMAGDPALYYNTKEKNQAANNDLKGQERMSNELAINLGKRMAAMIAPGNVLANSNNNSYMQVFLSDQYGPAENLADIIEMHYGKDALQEYDEESGLTYAEMVEVNKTSDEFESKLENKFTRIAEFVSIESTDAQEYTTLKEHLYVMRQQGRISTELSNKIADKVAKGEDLTKEDLGLVLQPIKPVYTGTLYDAAQDVNRMMYIKSSSFPLIPQLTKNRNLDKLRVEMEKVEEVTKMTVRASYGSANKVGGLDQENLVQGFDSPILVNNMLELKREHFKIQQDVPFKSKEVQDDTVSMGTQIFKLLMGDGIMEMNGFKYQGKTMTGKELQSELFEVFSEMVGLKKDKFLSSLGMDANMQSEDPAKTMVKLQRLLHKEAKSRGFSKQDLKILDLVDGVDGAKTFKLPLWLTANSNKYEAMLNAMINNKIFKQKIPGNKFVTGSEAGFKLQENLKGVKASRIVSIGNYKRGPLSGTHINKDGVEVAQVLLPSKFKLGGVLIDLFEEFDGKSGVYLTTVNGEIRIKENMIDKELLKQFVFRIPTSSHGLGSAIEVAGFLPPESGDLIVTPKGFVTQMGQDFDVDSLTAYQYNHIVMESGEIKVLNEKNEAAFIHEKEVALNVLRDDIKKNGYAKLLASVDNAEGADVANNKIAGTLALINQQGAQTEEEVLQAIEDTKQQLKKDFRLKLAENKFIELHNSVYSNPSTQPLINKVLSMAVAEKQADEIESLTRSTSNTFNILSPKYQMEKMNAGSTGKVGIGIYAKGVTLHSLVQQSKSDGNELRLGSVKNDGTIVHKNVVIGNMKSNGTLGGSTTIPSSDPVFAEYVRRISTVLDERANTATDNEKAQILGRVGLNHKSAIAVDSLMALLGMDMEYSRLTKEEYDPSAPFHRKAVINGKEVFFKEHSLPYMLHSQPIIKEYFELVASKKSQTTEFTLSAELAAEADLLKKYGKGKLRQISFGKLLTGKKTGGKTKWESTQDNTEFTADFLESQITLGEAADTEKQLEILAVYLDLISEAEKVKKMMEQVDLNNLGKSMFESTTKAKDFRDYLTDNMNQGILGADKLLGETIDKNDDYVAEEGDIDLGNNVILRPRTNQGVMVGSALSLSEGLFTNVFPAKNRYLNSILEQIIAKSNINAKNSRTVWESKEKIFQEVKKYLTSSQGLGIFNKSAKDVRRELFMDDKVSGNESLSTYVGNVKNSKSEEHKEGIDKIKNNLFLNLLKPIVGESGKPSLLTFNNQESFEANQEAIYTSFKELIAEDYSLPSINRNGVQESYSTRILAQELIAYSYASGGVVQGAVEFHKFLPIEYLEDMTYKTKGGDTQTVSERLRRYNTFNQVKGQSNILGNFERQFFQNNPEYAAQESLQKIVLKDGSVIYQPKTFNGLTYIAQRSSTKSKLKQDKWTIYERIEGQKVYREIAVLGETGMAEYDFGVAEVESNLGNKEVEKTGAVSSLELKTIEHKTIGNIPADGSKMKDFLAAIEAGQYGEYSNMQEMAAYLQEFITADQVFNYTDKQVKGRVQDGVLYLNPDLVESNQDLAVTFMHEIVHVLTSPYVNEYTDKLGELLPGAPAELVGLNNVLQEYKKGLIAENPKKYAEFQAKWDKYRKDRKENLPSTVTFTQEELSLYYPTVNLKEFMATALGNNKEFKAKAKNMPYLKSGDTVLRKFGHFISNFVKRLGKAENIGENTVALQAMTLSMEIVESANKGKKAEKAPVEGDPDVRAEEMRALMEHYKDVEPPLDEDSFADSTQGAPDILSDPGNDVADENSASLLPMMTITKNKCK